MAPSHPHIPSTIRDPLCAIFETRNGAYRWEFVVDPSVAKEPLPIELMLGKADFGPATREVTQPIEAIGSGVHLS